MSKEIINLYTGMPYSERAKEERLKVARLPASDPIILKKLDKLYASNDVLIVKAQTGAGKSAVVAPHIMQLENPEKDKINKVVITQPRTTNTLVADYIKILLDAPIVDYAYRFNNNLQPQTRLAYMTDGLLLTFFYRDPTLPDYKCVIIDELHERNIAIDQILTFLKLLYKKGIKKKVVLMSATMNPQFYKNYFNSAGIIEIEGRSFPIKNIWLEKKENYLQQAIETVELIIKTDKPAYDDGILIFLSSVNELRQACKLIAMMNIPANCYELHKGTNEETKEKILDNNINNKYKIVFSSNVAESGITVPNIKYVIESGRRYESTFNAQEEMEELNERFISQAEAEQRAGRAGRVKAGICYRLYSEKDFSEFSEFKDPEILTQEISPFLLNLFSLYQYKEVMEFMNNMPTPPTEHQIKYAFKILESLKLLENNKITTLGTIVNKIPLTPNESICLLYARAYNVDYSVCTIMAMISIDAILDNWFISVPDNLAKEQNIAKDNWYKKGKTGEVFIFEALLSAFLKDKNSEGFCKKHYLHLGKMMKAKKVFYKLRDVIKTISSPFENIQGEDKNKIVKCFQYAYPNNIGILESFNIFKIDRPVQYIEVRNKNKHFKVGKKILYLNIVKIKGTIWLSSIMNLSN